MDKDAYDLLHLDPRIHKKDIGLESHHCGCGASGPIKHLICIYHKDGWHIATGGNEVVEIWRIK